MTTKNKWDQRNPLRFVDDSSERAWDVGHALTFKILMDDTKRVVKRSKVRLSKSGENNLKLDVEAGAVPERIYI